MREEGISFIGAVFLVMIVSLIAYIVFEQEWMCTVSLVLALSIGFWSIYKLFTMDTYEDAPKNAVESGRYAEETDEDWLIAGTVAATEMEDEIEEEELVADSVAVSLMWDDM